MTTRILPVTLTQEEVMALALELANTVQAMGAEVEEQKNLKDQMKARLSELQAKQTRLSIVVATGKEYRSVEVTLRLVSDTCQEVRTDTGEVVASRVATAADRQLALETGA